MAYNLMLFPIQNISSVIAWALFPSFARIQNDDARFRSAYTRSCMLIGLITFPVMAGIGVIADPFIRTLLGPKWIPVIPVFQILVPVGVVQSIQTTVGQIYLSKGRTDWMFRWGIVSTICLVTSFVVGVRWGIMIVAASYAIVYGSVVAYAGFAIPFRLIGLTRVRDFAAALAPQIGITLIMASACAMLLFVTGTLAAPVRLVLSVSLGIAVYVGLMMLLKPPVIRELAAVIDQIGHARLSPLVRKYMNAG